MYLAHTSASQSHTPQLFLRIASVTTRVGVTIWMPSENHSIAYASLHTAAEVDVVRTTLATELEEKRHGMEGEGRVE
jgi:hypothetical protein